MHRIQPLEASQVYVAWVKVFGHSGPDGVKSMESKQKGFKTKEAKERTIWDEKDHVILGGRQLIAYNYRPYIGLYRESKLCKGARALKWPLLALLPSQ